MLLSEFNNYFQRFLATGTEVEKLKGMFEQEALRVSETLHADLQKSKRYRTARSRFLPSEDKLLLIGLLRFGSRDIDQLRNTLLPAKRSMDIKNRYKNQATSNSLNTKLIRYKTVQQKRPIFSFQEIGALLNGIRQFQLKAASLGTQTTDKLRYLYVSKNFLQHKGPDVVRNFVKYLVKNGITIPSNFHVAMNRYKTLEAFVSSKIQQVRLLYADLGNPQVDTWSV